MNLIPEQFNILGHQINVYWSDESVGLGDNIGMSDYQLCHILLQESSEQRPMTQTCLEHTYFHEVVHFILGSMNEDKLNQNEKFVDTFAGLLHQVMITSVYK